MNTLSVPNAPSLGLRGAGSPPPFDVTDFEYACQILGGKYFWPLNPEHPSNRFLIEDIAHSLANQARWGGWINDLKTGEPLHYSVAQHSVHVADLTNVSRGAVSALLAKQGYVIDWEKIPSPAGRGLMHDATEAYLIDIPRPIKGELGDYYAIEKRLDRKIMQVFDIPVTPAIDAVVKWVDNAMIFWERDALVGQPELPYLNENMHPGTSIYEVIPDFRPWSAAEAKQRFIEKFYEIKRFHGDFVPTEYAGRGYGVKIAA